jgi:exoribonuclease-2
VVALGEKIEIELPDGQKKRVRLKDVELLHPGPLMSFAELQPCSGESDEAWSLLEGSDTNLRELTELIHDGFTPAQCWSVWQLVAAGEYFTGSPTKIRVRTREEIERDRAERAAKAAAEADWRGFLERVAQARLQPEDCERLAEVERLALGQSEHSRVLVALGHQASPQNAHRALIHCHYWPADHNPYPQRAGVMLDEPALGVPDLAVEERRTDLTHLPAYAIDDEGNQDPDDALSLDGDRLWVHVADVAALVEAESELEREARARGANLYLPEGIINMLPGRVTERLGLGLQEVSPALSFGFRCTASGEPIDLRIEPSWVRVRRLTYEEVEKGIDTAPFAAFDDFIAPFRARRLARQAASIDLPEVSVKVRDGRVSVHPLVRLRSRALVTDAMLMVGEAVACFCQEHGIPIPFACQPAPSSQERPTDLAGMYSFRRKLKPTRLSRQAEPHAGLGLPCYTRTTSPLRRYSDLVVHQQLRAWLRGEAGLTADELMARIAEADMASAAVRRAERLSNQHWKLIFLQRHEDWRGDGVVVDSDNHKATVLLPDLAMDARVRLRGDVVLNERVRLVSREVDLPDLTVVFSVR